MSRVVSLLLTFLKSHRDRCGSPPIGGGLSHDAAVEEVPPNDGDTGGGCCGENGLEKETLLAAVPGKGAAAVNSLSVETFLCTLEAAMLGT